MTVSRLQFPHISRIFSAKTFLWAGNLSLWLMLGTLISLNIFLRQSTSLAYSNKVFQIFTRPFAASPHAELARSLWDTGLRTFAGHEAAIVSELSPVLGASTMAGMKEEEKETAYWENILDSRPDYRDAYVQLAALSYREGNLTGAHAYLLRAQTLDPNNVTVNNLLDFTSKLLE